MRIFRSVQLLYDFKILQIISGIKVCQMTFIPSLSPPWKILQEKREIYDNQIKNRITKLFSFLFLLRKFFEGNFVHIFCEKETFLLIFAYRRKMENKKPWQKLTSLN